MDYRQLTKLLETGKWRKADEHTWEILLQIAVREDEGWLSAADIDCFPPTDLRTIDKLWQQHSSGRFGFTVQQQIWESTAGNYTQLCDRVGWRVKENWKYYSELSFSENAPPGHLPVTAWRHRSRLLPNSERRLPPYCTQESGEMNRLSKLRRTLTNFLCNSKQGGVQSRF
ncbi:MULTISPECIES: GUN4 domain-containing protein [unclassified Microcoleus]|uniref:GUN4 domain-containing protein n=1 Tax=unclassified Microcoleus TaxID=2642155 RepID=UPI0025E516A6|nr:MULTISPECIES: GUN4 domain-containing protein [unclassified Microcoleus]